MNRSGTQKFIILACVAALGVVAWILLGKSESTSETARLDCSMNMGEHMIPSDPAAIEELFVSIKDPKFINRVLRRHRRYDQYQSEFSKLWAPEVVYSSAGADVENRSEVKMPRMKVSQLREDTYKEITYLCAKALMKSDDEDKASWGRSMLDELIETDESFRDDIPGTSGGNAESRRSR